MRKNILLFVMIVVMLSLFVNAEEIQLPDFYGSAKDVDSQIFSVTSIEGYGFSLSDEISNGDLIDLRVKFTVRSDNVHKVRLRVSGSGLRYYKYYYFNPPSSYDGRPFNKGSTYSVTVRDYPVERKSTANCGEKTNIYISQLNQNADGSYQNFAESSYQKDTTLVCDDVCSTVILDSRVCRSNDVQSEWRLHDCSTTWSIDEDCDYGCSNGECLPECTSDSQCGELESCSGRECVVTKDCVRDSQCNQGTICDLNLFTCINDAECNSDFECSELQKCQNQKCENVVCDGYVVNHECVVIPPNCNNNDCAIDEACLSESCQKLECGDNEVIENHQCVAQVECVNDQQCGNYATCVIGDTQSENQCVEYGFFEKIWRWIISLFIY